MMTILTTVYRRGDGLGKTPYTEHRNYMPCPRCSEHMRVAHQEDAAFDSPGIIKVFVVCNNCYYGVWMNEEFYERFIKENRVI